MNFEELQSYMLKLPASELDYPFGVDVSVFKVKSKMFALLGYLKGVMILNLKCDPEESWILRDIFDAIKPGYHMNKTHWITLYFDGTVPDGEVQRLIDNSYQLIVSKLPKKQQQSLKLHSIK